jgi:hypothetical protein
MATSKLSTRLPFYVPLWVRTQTELLETTVLKYDLEVARLHGIISAYQGVIASLEGLNKTLREGEV